MGLGWLEVVRLGWLANCVVVWGWLTNYVVGLILSRGGFVALGNKLILILVLIRVWVSVGKLHSTGCDPVCHNGPRSAPVRHLSKVMFGEPHPV